MFEKFFGKKTFNTEFYSEGMDSEDMANIFCYRAKKIYPGYKQAPFYTITEYSFYQMGWETREFTYRFYRCDDQKELDRILSLTNLSHKEVDSFYFTYKRHSEKLLSDCKEVLDSSTQKRYFASRNRLVCAALENGVEIEHFSVETNSGSPSSVEEICKRLSSGNKTFKTYIPTHPYQSEGVEIDEYIFKRNYRFEPPDIYL